MLSDKDYETFIQGAANLVSKQFDVDLNVDLRVISEIKVHTERSLTAFNQDAPNAAKQAGNLVFWIRKLKPVSNDNGYFGLANEYIALLCGIAVLNASLQKTGKKIVLGKRPLTDFAHTLRFHSHSPNGLTLSFELFLTGSLCLI